MSTTTTNGERRRQDPRAEALRVFRAQSAKRWQIATSTSDQRIERLRRLRAAIVDRREALASAVHADFGKNPAELELTEIFPVLEEIDHVIAHLDDWMHPDRVKAPLVMTGTRSTIRYEPRGVVLVMAPWNYQFNLLFIPLVSAMAAGNTVVLKPSRKTSHLADAAAELIRSTFPEDEVAIFTGGHDVADALLELPFDHLLFTGSTRIGKKVMRAAAEHMASVTLELGGKSPAIVDRSADVEAAATRVIWGKCVNAGQTCISPDYVLAHEAVAERFEEAARHAIERFYGETPEAREASPDLARMIDHGAWDRVTGLLADSVEQGARVVVGGRHDRATRYIEPTVLAGVRPDMPVMREEIFGPVLPVLTVSSAEEACAFVRERAKPLALYVFAKDADVVDQVLSHTTSGGSVVNDVFLHFANPNLPFGGVGASGQGSYHGEHGFRTFSHARAVVDRRPTAAIGLLYPPYESRRSELAQRLLRIIG